jgi:hypothetical protein
MLQLFYFLHHRFLQYNDIIYYYILRSLIAYLLLLCLCPLPLPRFLLPLPLRLLPLRLLPLRLLLNKLLTLLQIELEVLDLRVLLLNGILFLILLDTAIGSANDDDTDAEKDHPLFARRICRFVFPNLPLLYIIIYKFILLYNNWKTKEKKEN